MADSGFTEREVVQNEIIYASQEVGWTFIPGSKYDRSIHDVILWDEFEKAIVRLNPIAAMKSNFVLRVKSDFESVIDGGKSMMDTNEDFMNMVRGNYTLPYGVNNEDITIRLIDFDNPDNNSFLLMDSVCYDEKNKQWGNQFDLVYYINGMPVIVGETKSPTRPSVTAYDAADEIVENYEKKCPKFFATNMMNFATEGKRLIYGPIGMPAIKWGPWYVDGLMETGLLESVLEIARSLLNPPRVLDLMANYNLFTSNDRGKRYKVLCRYQQYEGANRIINRVLDGQIKKGLIWHFQGSGKTFLMIFAAQKLRKLPQLKNPTVMIVIDRDQLNTQSYKNFTRANAANVELVESSSDLNRKIKAGTKKILISTIQKFGDIDAKADEDNTIIVFVDEAHRSNYSILAQKMRNALPHAYYFGFTGTPIAHKDRNTFETFGNKTDPHGYLSKYGYDESVRDHETLEMHFESRSIEVAIDREGADEDFDKLTKNLTPEQKKNLADLASNFNFILMTPKAVDLVCEDIAQHFKEKVEPTGFKVMVVAANRMLCVMYYMKLTELLGEGVCAVDITVGDEKSEPEYQKWKLDSEKEEALLERYDNPEDPLKILIVTSKLLTGFDSPILQTMYLVKRMKEHNLLQAICRTNRIYTLEKNYGLIVDYRGIFTNVKKALKYSGEDLTAAVTNIETYKPRFEKQYETCLNYFASVDTKDFSGDSLKKAQNCLKDKETRDSFGKFFIELQKSWEILCPDVYLAPFTANYIWMCGVYESIRPPGTGKLIWKEFGGQTQKIIEDHTYPLRITASAEEMILDEKMIKKALVDTSYEYVARLIGNHVHKKINDHEENPFYMRLGSRLQKLQDDYEAGIINNEMFLKRLLELSKELAEEERKQTEMEPLERTNLALTKLFNAVKADYPDIDEDVETIVQKIDDKIIEYAVPEWDTRDQVKKRILKEIKTLIHYQYGFKEEVAQKAYEYVLQYYNPDRKQNQE